MSKKLVLALASVAVLLTAFSIALSRRDSQDWRANRSRRLFPFPWQDTASITLSRPGDEPLFFSKSPRGEWQIRLDEDLEDLLGYDAVDELSALATLAWREPMRDAPGFSEESAVLVEAVSHTGQKVNLALGGGANNLRAVAVDGDYGNLYGVNQDLLKFIDWPRERFRNLNLAVAPSGSKPRRVVLAPSAPDDSLRIVLEKIGDEWRQVEPVPWPVDEARLDLLLRWFDRLRAASVEAELSGDLEWFGFTPQSTRVEIDYDAPGGPLKRRVDFGKETDGDRVYAKAAERNPVFALPRESLAEISLNIAADYPDLWRNFYRRRSLSALGGDVPTSITVERLLPVPVKLVLEQVPDRDGVKWQGTLTRGETTSRFAVEPPDPAEPMRPLTALLTGLSSLRVKTFLADVAPGPETIRWTAYPAWRFSSQGMNGEKTPVLTLYAADADGALPPGRPFVEGKAEPQEMTPGAGIPGKAGVAFSVDTHPAVMETFAELAYLLCLPPYRYQSRRLVESDPRLWEKVEIATPEGTRVFTGSPGKVNEQWWFGEKEKAEPLMDDNYVFVGMLLELSRLRADGFAAGGGAAANESAVEFGLDQPAITAIVYMASGGEDGETAAAGGFRLAVGNRAGPDGGQRYARLDDAGPVFLIPDRLAEALVREYR